jgi:lambda family phage portal protein
MSGASGYQAAKRELASLRRFVVRPRTADEDALPGLPEMRARSREMLMNAPLASGAVKTVVTNVVGTGLRVSAQADRGTLLALEVATEDDIQAMEHAFEREFRLFCRSEHCDAAQRLSFAEMQELAFRTVLASGDCFAAMVAAPGRFGFAVQLFEADRVSNPSRKPNSETLADGVEYDAAGKPVAIHVAELPRTGVGARNWRRLPLRAPDGAPRVLHMLHAERIGQSRGVPYLAPVIGMLKDLDRYSQAEITAAVLNACIAILGKGPDGGSPLKSATTDASTGGLRQADINFESGMVLEGFMPGETIKSFSPDRPSQGFDPFVQAVLRQVGVALELPFEILIKHFTASYSAARAALLQAWGFFMVGRGRHAAQFCQPIYEAVITSAVLSGRLEVPGFLQDPVIRAAWLGTRWTGPSMGQIQPEAEVRAAERRIALQISSRARETAALTGDDWEAVAAELAGEAALLDRLGLPRGDAMDAAALAPPDPEPDSDNEAAPAPPSDEATP